MPSIFRRLRTTPWDPATSRAWSQASYEKINHPAPELTFERLLWENGRGDGIIIQGGEGCLLEGAAQELAEFITNYDTDCWKPSLHPHGVMGEYPVGLRIGSRTPRSTLAVQFMGSIVAWARKGTS